jgi:glycerol-3-phosphate acyltransferase PlsY
MCDLAQGIFAIALPSKLWRTGKSPNYGYMISQSMCVLGHEFFIFDIGARELSSGCLLKLQREVELMCSLLLYHSAR